MTSSLGEMKATATSTSIDKDRYFREGVDLRTQIHALMQDKDALVRVGGLCVCVCVVTWYKDALIRVGGLIESNWSRRWNRTRAWIRLSVLMVMYLLNAYTSSTDMIMNEMHLAESRWRMNMINMYCTHHSMCLMSDISEYCVYGYSYLSCY